MNLESLLNNGRKKEGSKGRESSLGGAGLRLEVKLLAPSDERSNEVSYPKLVTKRIRELGVAVGGAGPQKQEPPPIGKVGGNSLYPLLLSINFLLVVFML